MDIVIECAEDTRCHRDWSWENKKNPYTKDWSGYHIWLVVSGEGRIAGSERVYHIQKGDVFLFNLKESYCCRHNPQDPLHVLAIHFLADAAQWEPALFEHASFLGGLVQRCQRSFALGDTIAAQTWLDAALQEMELLRHPSGQLSELVLRMKEYLEENCCQTLHLSEMVRQFPYSPNYLIAKFKKETGMTPVHYALVQRIERAKTMLVYTGKSLSELSAELGYHDLSHFSRQFKAVTGMAPSQLRKPPAPKSSIRPADNPCIHEG